MPTVALKQLRGFVGSVSSTLTSVAATTSSVQLLVANTSRAGATFYNASSATLYLRMASGAASTTSYTLVLNSGGYFELPYAYSGAVSGVWSAADGGVNITEVS